MAVNPMFRSIILRHVRGWMKTGALASLAMAGFGVIGALAGSGWRVYASYAATGFFAMVAVALIIASSRVDKRPDIVELFAKSGTIMRITTGDKLVRVLLGSGTEVRIPVAPREVDKIVQLLRGHSPKADVTSHI